MFCWSCGHENSDDHKFCGECGRSLYKPEKVVQDITTAKNFSRADDTKTSAPDSKRVERAPETPPAPRGTYLRPPEGTLLSPPVKQPDTTAVPREPEVPKQTNLLIEEPRVVHEKPIASTLPPAQPPVTTSQPPTMIRDRVPNRITGPSFLGLSDEGSSGGEESSYLLDDEAESSSPWRGYLMLALLVVVSLLVIRNWGDIRSFAAEKFGGTDTVKHPAGPERVTASNDASQITPDAAPEEGKTDATTNNKSEQKDSKPQQTAKLEKPQSDRESDTANKAEDSSKKEEDTSDAKSKPADSPQKPAAPAYDNSQLEEAQKYLQGRGVPQDCNRGVSLLRDAAKQPNPKARIQMAALYVSGHCVTADVTQAYNWFAKAQELEPHNRLIERNLDSLWARMTDEERRKVLR